jgi:1-acyl-sn-glycerol-3-phosphate acyltransferase
MPMRAERMTDWPAWRLLGTAASFALFGLGGIVLGCLVLPLARLVPTGAGRRQRFARWIISRGFRGFIECMRLAGVLSYEFKGRERLGRAGQLIIANHPSLIDVVFLIGFTPVPCCVVKATLWRNPVTGHALASARYIPNQPTDTMIEAAGAALEAGDTLILFPEGTRSVPGEPLQFHRGAAVVALRAAAALTPVHITVNPTTLTKQEPWYRIPGRRPHFALQVGADIDLAHFRGQGPTPIASRALNTHLASLFDTAA